MATTAAVVTTGATLVAAGAAAYNSYLSWDAARDAEDDAEDLAGKRRDQAADILTQIEDEDIIYQDELDMIQKQSAMAETKLTGQTTSALEQVGEKLSAAMYQQPSKYEAGAGGRQRSKLRQSLSETTVDIQDQFKMGLDELALQDEIAERDALLRHEEIIGSLEAMGKELEEEPTDDSEFDLGDALKDVTQYGAIGQLYSLLGGK